MVLERDVQELRSSICNKDNHCQWMSFIARKQLGRLKFSLICINTYLISYIDSMSVNCAIELAIPDIIHSHGRPITLPHLASKLHFHPKKTSCLHRLMRLLVHSGFFTKTKLHHHHHHHQNQPEDDEEKEEEEEEGYALTPSSRLVIKDNVTSLSPFVKAMLDPVLVSPWHVLGDWLQVGSTQELTPFEKTHGMSLWNYVQLRSYSSNLVCFSLFLLQTQAPAIAASVFFMTAIMCHME